MAKEGTEPDYIFLASKLPPDIIANPTKYSQAVINYLQAAFTEDVPFDGKLYPFFAPPEQPDQITFTILLVEEPLPHEQTANSPSAVPDSNPLFGIPIEISEAVSYLPSDHLVQILQEVGSLIQAHGLDQPRLRRVVNIQSPRINMIQDLAQDIGVEPKNVKKMAQDSVREIVYEIVNEAFIAALSSAADTKTVVDAALPIYLAYAQVLPQKTIAYLQYLTQSDAVWDKTGQHFYDQHVTNLIAQVMQGVDRTWMATNSRKGTPSTTTTQIHEIRDFLREA